MDRTRFEFLKGVAAHFRENPETTHYLGVSRETCSSLLALHFSTPEGILDPTALTFPKQVEEKINQFGENFNQNQPSPLTVPLPQELESATQNWQEEAAQEKPLPQHEAAGRLLEGKLKDASLKTWEKIKPDWGPKMNQFLGSKGKAVGRVLGAVGKVAGVVGFTLAAVGVSTELIKRAIKYFGAALYAIYSFFAALGTAALVGAIAGGIVGGLAGGVAGAILGAKLGAAIGGAVGGPVGAAIGGTLGGITGFVIGSGLGAVIGAAILGTLGYAIEHWLWQPAQNLWTTGGNFLGAGGNFLGTLWTGFWTGVGNLASAAFSWAGGAATATANFFAGLGAQLSGVSLAPVATVPLLGTIGLGVGFTLWLGTDIVGTSFMRPPVPEGIPPVVSEYIALTKIAQPALLQNSDVEGAGKDITYTITIGAPLATLINVRVTEQTLKITGGVTTEITVDKNGASIVSWLFPQINQGQTQTITYQIHADESFKNTTITNSVTVLADVPSASKLNETKVVRSVVNIAASLIAGSCGICNTTQGSFEWRKLLTEAGTAYQVPGALLAGISKLETGVPWGYTDAQVIAYSAPGASMVPCPTSIDGAQGAFQFMPSSWAAYGGAAIDKGVRPLGYTPNICNLLDAAYAAAAKLAYDVTTISDASVCGDGGSELIDPATGGCLVPITIPSGCGWTQQNVYHGAAHYLGMCIDPRFPSVTYCRTVYFTYYLNWQCP